jgi:hypothetical protein
VVDAQADSEASAGLEVVARVILGGRLSSRVARWFVFKPKNPNFVEFWLALHWKMVVYVMGTWSILRSFDIFY